MKEIPMVKIEVPEKLYQDLQALAETKHSTVTEVIQELVEVELEADIEELTTEEVLEDFREAWRWAKAGGKDGIPAREALAQIRRERNQNGN
jgi:predicted DNA-binding protein